MGTKTRHGMKAVNGTNGAPKRYQLLDDRVKIRVGAPLDRTEGGILLPDSAQIKPDRGTVVAVGPGKRHGLTDRIPMTVEVGDVVDFLPYAGLGGTDIGSRPEAGIEIVVREDDIIAIVG